MVAISTEDYCKSHNEKKLGNITEGEFCASRVLDDGRIVDTCEGDSGGPLYCPDRSKEGQPFFAFVIR